MDKNKTVGEALGLSKQRNDEIVRLAEKIASKSQTKHEIIIRLQKQGLEKTELLLAVFVASAFVTNQTHRALEEMRKEIKTVLAKLSMFPKEIRGKIIITESGPVGPNGECICDGCSDSGRCPGEKEMRLEYERVKGEKEASTKEETDKHKKIKKKKGIRIEIE